MSLVTFFFVYVYQYRCNQNQILTINNWATYYRSARRNLYFNDLQYPLIVVIQNIIFDACNVVREQPLFSRQLHPSTTNTTLGTSPHPTNSIYDPFDILREQVEPLYVLFLRHYLRQQQQYTTPSNYPQGAQGARRPVVCPKSLPLHPSSTTIHQAVQLSSGSTGST